jgi:hypothetical protein
MSPLLLFPNIYRRLMIARKSVIARRRAALNKKLNKKLDLTDKIW